MDENRLDTPALDDDDTFGEGIVLSIFWCPCPAKAVHPPTFQFEGRPGFLVGHMTPLGDVSREDAKQAANLAIDGIFDAVDSMRLRKKKEKADAP